MKLKPEKRLQLKKPLILIVDDVPKNLQILGTLLRKIDCELAVATDGHQALNTIERVKPDLILLDIMMPGMNGFEVCRQLKSDDETRDIPVIFLTANDNPEDITKGFELGAVDYITKPVNAAKLYASVNTQLSLHETKAQLREQLNSKSKIFSIISHDLHGSLGIILSFIQVLHKNRKEFSEEEIDEILENISSSAKGSLNLLENLLAWARSQSGRIKFVPTEIKPDKFINDILKSLREAARKKQIEMSSTVNVKSIKADKDMLLLIFRNLISNAIKFTPSGGKISISAVEENSSVKFLIKDNGLGMDKEKVEKLFKTDENISTPGTDKELGNGLGLILCKEFIQYHNGRIGIESTPEKGTTAWITIPADEIDEQNL